ncbi:MAG: hypothetical protein EPN93_09445 [Spirochaetes bacterium]|nr:MAG: hypothetical protein EPN93_09445 [Spirochaetota bacterium]
MNAPLSARVLKILEWDQVLGELAARTSSEPGAQCVRALAPAGKERIEPQLRMITEIKELLGKGEAPSFSGVTDIAPSCVLARKGGSLKLAEIAAVREFVIASQALRGFLTLHRADIPSLSDELSLTSPLKEIGASLIPALTDANELSEARYPVLARLKGEMFRLRQETEKALLALVYAPSMERAVQERVFTTRNDRYVILVKAQYKNSVRGTALDVSSSGQTVYMEPDGVHQANNRLISLSVELQMEIGRIVRELSELVGAHADELMANLERAAYLDFLCAAAALSAHIRGSAPEVLDEPRMQLYGARHPLLYLMNPGGTVANDISLGDPYRCLIISGANTGGKTVLMKTIGLSALLLMHGLHLPAGPDSRAGLYTDIMADIGDDQSIAQSLSSFSGQIVVMGEMIERARPGSLVLIDEIAQGTNPRQGAALAQALLERLVESGASIIVTTHYGELKELGSGDARFVNASVSFDMETLAPTYRLHVGIPGASYAIEIARNYGVPEDVLARAQALLDERSTTAEGLIESLQRHARELDEERARLGDAQVELDKEKRAFADKVRRQAHTAEELKFERGVEFLDELRSFRVKIASRMKEIQQAGMKDAVTLQKEALAIEAGVRGRMQNEGPARFLDRYANFDPDAAIPGARVLVIPLEKEGTLGPLDRAAGTAEVVLGRGLKSRYRWKDLMLPRGAPPAPPRKEKPKEPEPEEKFVPLTVQTSYNTVDMRGMRVEEALAKMESEFDRMTRSGIRVAVVIHGHGTGALKAAVRSTLPHSGYVMDFRPGEMGEGGDGVTIVTLRD